MEEQRSQQGRRTLTRFRVGRIGNGHLSLVEPSGRAGEFSGLSSASRVWARKRTRVKQVDGLSNQRSHASDNTLGLRCARFARWPPQARERGSSGRASDTASPGCRRALAAS